MSKHKIDRKSPSLNRRQANRQHSPISLWNAPSLESIQKITKVFSPYWLACIPLAAVIFVVWNSSAVAQDTPLKAEDVQGMLNMIWVLIASILVIFMNAGFAMLETGFCRQKNAVNVLAKNLIVFALSTISFWATGFSLMFANINNGFIGAGGWFLSSNDPATYNGAGALPVPVFFLFQVAFAGTAATIVSGAVAERIKFVDFLIFSLLLVGISYPITGHWVWGGGWLSTLGFKDFAGSTVVHAVGGCAALVGAAVLGPREGKYRDGRINAIPGHNMSIATLGCLILWIGWFGFNPGSELIANTNVPYIAVTTNLAGAAGGIAATITSWTKDGKPDLSMVINGILAGLVAITAGCAYVSFVSAAIIGLIAGVLVVYAVSFFDNLRIDDPVGATSVHLVNGIWGTLAVGLFAADVGTGYDVKGLFFGGGVTQLINQIIGLLACCAFTLVFCVVVWIVLKAVFGLRVSLEEEINGLDIGEHGMEAYSGFVKESDIFGGSRGTSVSGVDLTSRSEI
ncbi:ammonium transporter [Candidatus Gracilibacteria bacterium]|nr:ammonium transporter [Candidatus Gracilibacteria bacterium]NJM87366.1 ammonium transporter [Hydrococcus sp. RU_2_2]NJP19824.1 ammonium transporter [Hydrococcus sp. CRU_1_1]